jgi:hypothetical protein
MPVPRKRHQRTRKRLANRALDPLPRGEQELRPSLPNRHRFLAAHQGVLEELLATLQAYLRDLAASETLLARLRTAQSPEELEASTRRLAVNAQARTAQLTTLQTLLALLTAPRADSDEEPPISVH